MKSLISILKVIIGIMFWVALIPINITFLLICYLLAPVLPLAASEDGWLPSWLSWFQTPDNSLDGDYGWNNEHWQFRKKLPEPFQRYVGRVGWLIRNPGYGMETTVIAAKQPLEQFKYWGNRNIKNGAEPVYGWLIVTSGIYWNVYVILPSIFGKTFRLYLGWKLRNGENYPFYQYALFFNPVMGR